MLTDGDLERASALVAGLRNHNVGSATDLLLALVVLRLEAVLALGDKPPVPYPGPPPAGPSIPPQVAAILTNRVPGAIGK